MALSDLPLASGQRHKATFEDLGWVVKKDETHIVMTHPHHPKVFLSIPNHPEVKKATLKGIIREAGITDAQYLMFFHGKALDRAPKELSDEDRFRSTPEADGKTRIHCMECGQQVCVSDDETVIALAKEQHIPQCSGPL